MYCAIIGDIIDSRNIKMREETQSKLCFVLDEINLKYSSDIAANFVITIGDEFQGLLKNPQRLLQIIDYVKINLYPVKFRFGIGIGELTTKVNPKMALGADGPVYYSAREAIGQLKENQNKNGKSSKDTMLIIHSDNIETAITISMINSLWSAIYLIEKKWTVKQRVAINEMLISKQTQRETAEALAISQSSLQRRLAAGEYTTYNDIKKAIRMATLKIWEGQNAG